MPSIAKNMADLIDDNSPAPWLPVIEAAWIRLVIDDELWFIYKDLSVLTVEKSGMTTGEIPRENFQEFLVEVANKLSAPLIREYSAKMLMRTQ